MTKKVTFWAALILAISGISGILPAQDGRSGCRFSDEKDLDARDAKRTAVFKEDRVLDLAGIKSGMRVAEIGAGDGYFTLMLASRVGVEGKVYANDIRKSVLNVIEERAVRHGLANIRTVLGTDDDPRLPERELDAAFMVFSFHEFDKPALMLARSAESLKRGARLFIIEFPQAHVDGQVKDRATYESVFKGSPFNLEAVDEKTLDIPEGPAVVYILALAPEPASVFSQKGEFPKLTGPYLGQKTPGKTPEHFGVEIFAPRYTDHHTNINFSPDGKEAYWSAREITASPNDPHIQGIYFSKIVNGYWTKPDRAPWDRSDDAPFISPDGKKLFFLSQRPIEAGSESDRETIWSMDRTADGWSEPKPLPLIINTMKYIHWGVSVDRVGNLYFGARGIYCSKYENGEYRRPEKLDLTMNQPGVQIHSPFISPDGSYLIFTKYDFQPGKNAKETRESGISRLYICYRRNDGVWTAAKEIRHIQMEGKDRYYGQPYVSPDGKYLFFLYFGGEVVNNSAIITHYWVEASFIEEMRKKELKKG